MGTRPGPLRQAFVQFRADQASSCAYKLRNSGYYAEAFAPMPGRCLRMVDQQGEAWTGHLCPQPAVGEAAGA